MDEDTKNNREFTCPAWSKEEIDSELIALSFSVRVSRRYHLKRCRFFGNWSHFIKAASGIAGSSAFIALIGNKESPIALWFTAIVSILSILNLVIDFSGKRSLHTKLYHNFSDLLIQIIEGEESYHNFLAWKSRKISIEKEEPPHLSTLNIICYNEEVLSQGCEEKYLVNINEFRKKLSDLLSFDSYANRKIIKNRLALKHISDCATK